MYFVTLQGRLLDSIRKRVQNGEVTERRLAGMSGISQPHIHNLLKGARALSPEIADRIMRTLDMSVFDLLGPEDGEAPELSGVVAADTGAPCSMDCGEDPAARLAQPPRRDCPASR